MVICQAASATATGKTYNSRRGCSILIIEAASSSPPPLIPQ